MGKFVGEYHGPVKRQCRDNIENQLPQGESRCLQGQDEGGPAERDMKKKVQPVQQRIWCKQVPDHFPGLGEREWPVCLSGIR